MDKDKMGKETNKASESGRAVFACVIAVILIICIQIAGTYLNLGSFLRRETKYPSIEAGLQSSLEQLVFSIDDAAEEDRKNVAADVYFRALSLRNMKEQDNLLERHIEDYGNSYVVKVEGDKVINPDGVEIVPEVTADALKGEKGIIEASQESEWRYFVAYNRIHDGYYAIKRYMASEGSDNLANVALEEIEAAYDGKAMLIDEDGRYIYSNLDLEAPDLRGSNGLDEEALDALLEKYAPYYVKTRSADGRYTSILFLSRSAMLSDSLSVTMIVALISVILALILIVWIYEIRKLIESGAAKKEMIQKYHPSVIKPKIRTFCILAVIAVLFAGTFSSAIGSLYCATWDSQNALSAVEQMIVDQRYVADYKSDILKESDVENAGIIADTISRDPKMRTRKQLKEFRDALSANYIMIYDRDGREILTDSSYVNMNIGSLDPKDMHTFRRVLNGKDSDCLEDVRDNVTGEKSDLIGVRMPSVTGEEGGGYNLLVISFPPAAERGVTLFRDTVDMVAALPSSYNGYMLLDKNKKIKYITDKDAFGKDPLDLGMKENEIRDSFMGEFKLDNDVYYGASREINDELFYYVAKTSVLRQGMLVFGFIEAVGFSLVLLAIFLILMKDYDRIYEDSLAEGNKGNRRKDSSEGFRSGIISRLPGLKRGDTPEAKAKAVLNLSGGIFIIIIGILSIVSAGRDHRDNLIPFIFSNNWNNGFNLFAIARVIFMICGVVVVWSIVSFIINVAVNLLDARGATVAKLVKNVLSYIVAAIVLYYSALYLGFDPGALLASVGIIGLAVSLGAKDIIADVFSGVSLIFEKAFQAGDIVEIDGVRGTVQELGVRTLKLFGDDNNLKVIRYSDIRKITNLSRSNSWCMTEFTVKNSVDTGELKKLLWAELPEIKARHKEILSDPVFTGITSINAGSITFGVRTECKESSMRKVRSIMNYEIRDILNHNGIDMM